MSKKLFSNVCFALAMPAYISTALASDPIPKHATFKIESAAVDETRVICVWTPPQYEKSNEPYPVLYMPDGGIKEDFPHIANTLAKMVAAKTIPPFILVGIENTERRRDLTGPSQVSEDAKIAPVTDGSSKFRKFIKEELFPEIDRRYKTTNYRAIIGESAAGLFVVESLMLKPDMFDAYIAMDPSIYWNDSYLVRTAPEHMKKFPQKPIQFWFSGSNAIDIQVNTRKLEQVLKKDAPKTMRWIYVDQPNEKHSTIFRSTKEKAIQWALNGKK